MADSIMYCQVLSRSVHTCAAGRVHPFDAKAVEAQAARILGARAGDVLHGLRATLGPPWTKDHRIALTRHDRGQVTLSPGGAPLELRAEAAAGCDRET